LATGGPSRADSAPGGKGEVDFLEVEIRAMQAQGFGGADGRGVEAVAFLGRARGPYCGVDGVHSSIKRVIRGVGVFA